MRQWLQVFREWRQRRTRFAQEWAFHIERTAAELESMGLTRQEARRSAASRMGRPSPHRRQALRELGGDFAGLARMLPALLLHHSPFFLPAVAALFIALVVPFIPLRAFFSRGFAIGAWSPVLLGGTIGLAVRVFPSRKNWRIWLYAESLLMLLAVAGVAFWAAALRLWRITPWPSGLLQGLVILGFLFAYVWLTVLVALFWWRDVCQRCPLCLQSFRMPLPRGRQTGILVDPHEVESICLQGHGSLTQSRWRCTFNPGNGLWQDLLNH